MWPQQYDWWHVNAGKKKSLYNWRNTSLKCENLVMSFRDVFQVSSCFPGHCCNLRLWRVSLVFLWLSQVFSVVFGCDLALWLTDWLNYWLTDETPSGTTVLDFLKPNKVVLDTLGVELHLTVSRSSTWSLVFYAWINSEYCLFWTCLKWVSVPHSLWLWYWLTLVFWLVWLVFWCLRISCDLAHCQERELSSHLVRGYQF